MKLLSIILLAFGASYSYAGHHSETFYQAHGGGNIVNAGWKYEVGGFKFSNPDEAAPLGQPAKYPYTKGHTFSLNYERGFTDMFSAGLGFNFSSVSWDNAGSAGSGGPGQSIQAGSGLRNIDVFFKGNYGLSFGTLYYGLDADLSFAAEERDELGKSNRALGHHNFTPYLGMSFGKRDGMNYGLKLEYMFSTEKTTEFDSGAPDLETEIGDTIMATAFFENALSDKSILGFSARYLQKAFDEDANGNDAGSEIERITLSLYGAVGCGCSKMNLKFLPKFSYNVLGDYPTVFIPGNEAIDIEGTSGSYAMEFAVRKEF